MHGSTQAKRSCILFGGELRKFVVWECGLRVASLRKLSQSFLSMPVSLRVGIELEGFTVERLTGVQYGQDYTCVSAMFVSRSYPEGQLQDAFLCPRSYRDDSVTSVTLPCYA